jgi:tetratricopeptide (TPR) repeat protein
MARSRPRRARAAQDGKFGKFGRFDLFAVFGAAFLVRIGVWLQIRSLPIVRSPQLDSLEYLEWGKRLASGDFTWPAPPPHGPGYPFFLALVLKLSGGSLDAAGVVQAALGALGCVLIASVGLRYFGRQAGLLAGLLLAAEGAVALVDVSLFSEGLLLVLLAAALLRLSPDGPPTLRAAVAAGAWIGLAALVRPTAVFLLPVAVASVFLRRGEGRAPASPEPGAGRASRAAVMLAAAGVVILPVTLMNLRATGAPLLVQGHGGFNFWIGNSPSRDGLPSVRPGAGWDRAEGEAVRAGFPTAGEQDRYFVRKTFREIGAAPLRWLRLVASKAVWTLQAEEVRDPFSFYFFRNEAPILRFLPGFGVLFPLAVLGAAFACARSPRPWVLLGAAAAWIASCALLVTSFRYRLPLVPVLAVFAGAGAVEAVGAIRAIRSRGRTLAVASAVLLAAALATRLRRHPDSRNFAEEWTATGLALNHERDLPGAESAFRKAVAENPSWSPAWSGLGVVAANRGDREQARASFERAVALEPGSILANIELARASAAAGRIPEAERAYRRALALAPREYDAVEGLAVLLLSQRRLEEAETLARRASEVSPESPSAHLLFARVLGAESRWTEALEEAKRACDLDPSRADAWITLGALWTDSAEPEHALEAFDRAERAGADPRSVEAGRRLATRALEAEAKSRHIPAPAR